MQNCTTKCLVCKSNIKYLWIAIGYPHPIFVLVKKSLLVLNTCTTRPAKKLSEEYLGPYEIIAKPGTHSFTLQLPKHMHAIHLVLHVSQLEPKIPNQIPNCVQPVPLPIEIDDELEYEIAEILDSNIDNQWRWKLLYFVCWMGYKGTDEENSWLPATELDYTKELVSEFHMHYPCKSRPLLL